MVKPCLAPFRELLKKNCKFYWDNNLEKLFQEAKSEIADKVLDGLTRFEVNRETGLTTDWCKAGVGFMLSQKYCNCPNITPSCCVGGWRTCMVGSRFTNKSESNYAPIEGELLAVTYGLKKTKYYTLGSEKLTVCVDHKPLLGVLGDTELEKIDNTRLEKLKEKTLGWRFRIVHTPGKSMPGTDALSRAPSSADLLMLQHFDANYEEEELHYEKDS